MVKSQLDPHFLFNTLSNIDVLIQKDAKKASDYLNKLSDIMRFMLYETKTTQIPLQKESAYLEKYIELQKIRTSNPNFVHYSIEGNIQNVQIAPMIFIPFVENAFKYAEGIKANNAIEISIKVEKNELLFHCKNHYLSVPFVKKEFGGLGNELIIRRLELLYSNKYTIAINDKDNVYSVVLQLPTFL
ncbi:MAG: hypothetical protein RLZZ292_2180 [Bacteroidota bacterium]